MYHAGRLYAIECIKKGKEDIIEYVITIFHYSIALTILRATTTTTSIFITTNRH